MTPPKKLTGKLESGQLLRPEVYGVTVHYA